MDLQKYSINEIEQAYKSETDFKVRERMQIILHLREGYTQRDVSAMIHVSVGKVPFWKKRFEEKGFDGLYDLEGRGRRSNLSEDEFSMLASALAEGFLMENGYTRPFKTKDVLSFIFSNFQIKYTPRHIQRILLNMGLRLKVPRPRHKKRNQENIDQFKKEFKKN